MESHQPNAVESTDSLNTPRDDRGNGPTHLNCFPRWKETEEQTTDILSVNSIEGACDGPILQSFGSGSL
jgi:hypothetical protein